MIQKDFITDEYVEVQLAVALNPKIREAEEKLETLRKRFVEFNPEKVRAQPALAGSSGTGWWLYKTKDETLEMLQADRLETPSNIIWGYNDRSATYDMGVDLFNLISPSANPAQIQLLNQCGHAPYREYPQEVTDLMVHFIGSVNN